MSEIPYETITVSSKDQEIWGQCWIVEDTAGADAQCYIQGPKRGDEILGLVQEALQNTATRKKMPIRHIYTSSNKGALALVQRTEGYTPIGKDQKGNDLFEKVYTPIQPLQ